MVIYQMYLDKESEALFEEFKKIAKREGKSMAQMIKEFMADYIKKHGQGNPAFSLEKWVQDPGFKAYPALDSDWQRAALDQFDDKDLQHIINKGYEIIHFGKIEAKKRDLIV